MVAYTSFVVSREPSDSLTVSYSTSIEQIRDPSHTPQPKKAAQDRPFIGVQSLVCSCHESFLGWILAGQPGSVSLLGKEFFLSPQPDQNPPTQAHIQWTMPEREDDHLLPRLRTRAVSFTQSHTCSRSDGCLHLVINELA
jgi:hypothetical protein